MSVAETNRRREESSFGFRRANEGRAVCTIKKPTTPARSPALTPLACGALLEGVKGNLDGTGRADEYG